jgi:glycosyltransferase involved in cell wall biosynthesis
MTRIALFDWVAGGHHPIYLRRFAEALQSEADVVVAAPDETVRAIGDGSIAAVSLGRPRPLIPPARRFTSDVRSVLREEIALIERVVDDSRPDHLVHLYADAILPSLVRGPTFGLSVSLLLFYPRAHYPAAFQTPLRFGERMRAAAKEVLVAAWRRKADAHALLTLDEEAARRWRVRRGAAAHWVPEPPVPRLADPPRDMERRGCIVYGALAERKGIDLLAAAVAAAPMSLEIVIAGEAERSFLPRLNELVHQMRSAGTTVDVRACRHSETEGLRALAGAKCAVLPYPAHDGMSRVLVEAASVGTPVVVHNRGLLGYLVRRYELGHAIDCRDAAALRQAILQLAEGEVVAGYRDNLARFASRFSTGAFQRALADVFHGRDGEPTTAIRRAAAAMMETRP